MLYASRPHRVQCVTGCVFVSFQDTPGFIVNRLLVPYMAEAVRLYERGNVLNESFVHLYSMCMYM